MTANVSVAAIDSVEMDGDEEDAMLEAVQGLALAHLPDSWEADLTLISWQFCNFQKQIEIELRDEQVPTFQQIADYERNLELASTE